MEKAYILSQKEFCISRTLHYKIISDNSHLDNCSFMEHSITYMFMLNSKCEAYLKHKIISYLVEQESALYPTS